MNNLITTNNKLIKDSKLQAVKKGHFLAKDYQDSVLAIPNTKLGRFSYTQQFYQWLVENNLYNDNLIYAGGAFGGYEINQVLGVDYIATAYDFGGTNNAVQTVAAQQPKPINNRFDFNGDGIRLELYPTNLQSNDILTCCCWAKGDFVRRSGFFYTGFTIIGGFGQILGCVDGRVHSYLISTTLQSDVLLTNNKWYHFAFTFDGTTNILYLNGQNVAQANLGYLVEIGSDLRDGIKVGQSNANNRSFNGLIDDIIMTKELFNPDIHYQFTKGKY